MPEQKGQTLGDLRQRIDDLDTQLLTLVNQRAQLAQVVAEIKTENGDAVFYRPEREAQVLRRVMAENP
ncbi:MAG TPA: chorismate mutase, partial [Porticoccaceae bacterium]|nr:chorismate mutase [Porticoccaceae bacterium]